MDKDSIIKELIYILDCYENKIELVSNQGQGLDGYSALHNFLAIARRAKASQPAIEADACPNCGVKKEYQNGYRFCSVCTYKIRSD